MNERGKSLLVYIGKCVTGTLLVFGIAGLLHYTDIGWCLVSVMLVLSPDGKDAISLGMTRIKANVVGAVLATLTLLVVPVTVWSLCIALAATLAVCYLLSLDAGIRSALAATIIILLNQKGTHTWATALERIIAVLAGCVIGLIVTFGFHFRRNNNPKQALSTDSEG